MNQASSMGSPLKLIAYGALAGVSATVVISALSQIVPWARNEPRIPAQADNDHAAAITPAGVLTQAQGPGPQGAAELFALKVAAGLFSRDISHSTKLAGLAVHYAYGAFWGAIYGLFRANSRSNAELWGASFGLGVYGIGPGWLVPAMKLMQKPTDAPARQTTFQLAGHAIYGLTVAEIFKALQRKAA
jgi:uncharacterized membrane protein YagU involved in acid resistance